MRSRPRTARTRFAAAVAALGLATGALVGAGAVAAWADEGLEFDASLEDVVLPYGQVTFFGTTDEPSIEVEVWLDGEEFMCSDPAPEVDGRWSCTTADPVPPGTWTFVAVQTVVVPDQQQIDDILLTVLLPVPQAESPSAVPYGAVISFDGSGGVAEGTIHVAITDPPVVGYECSAGPLAADGDWACDIPTAGLDPGQTITVTVTQTLGENDPRQSTWQVYIGQLPPGEVEFSQPTDGQPIAWEPGAFLPLNGGAPVTDDPVDILIDEAPLCTSAVVDVDGRWDCGTVPIDLAGAATFGPRTLTAWHGSASVSIGIDLRIPAPQVDDSYSTGLGDTTLWVFGEGGIEDFIVTARLQEDGDVFCTAAAGSEGGWSCGIDVSTLPAGDYTLRFEQRPDPDPGPGVGSETASAPLHHAGPLPDPTIGCEFVPGGVRTWPGHDGIHIEYYSATPIEGTGYEPSIYGACSGRPGIENVGNEFDYDLRQTCTSECTLNDLPPGLHNLAYHWHEDCEGEGMCSMAAFEEIYDYYFRIPATPVIQAVASTDTAVILHGSGTPGDTLRVDAVSGGAKCTTTVGGSGTWTCAFPRSATALVRAVDIDAVSGGMSHYSAVRTVPVAAEPDTEPTIPLFLITWLLDFGDQFGELRPGDTFEVTSDGLPDGTAIEVWIHSEPRLLATAIATGGPMAIAATVPMDIEPGAHTIRIIATTPGGEHLMQEAPVAVVPLEVAKSALGDASDGPEGVVKNPRATVRTDRNDPVAPTALTGSIPTIADVLANPVVIAIAAGLALALLALVALPSEILNSALSSNTDRLGRGYRAIQSAFERARDWFVRVTRSRAFAALLLVIVVAFCHSFVDPGFGVDLVSLRLWLSLAVAYFVLSYVAAWISGRIVRAAWGAKSWVSIEPSVVAFAILGVIVARLLEFTPGFLVGVAIGLELARATRQARTGALLVQFGTVVGFSLLAWAGASLFEAAGGATDFWSALAGDTLVAITAEGLTGALIAAFPLRFLDGRDLWEESKALWAGVFLVVGTAFCLLVLPTAMEGTEVADYATWLAVFCGFTLLSLGVWWLLARADGDAEAADEARDGAGDRADVARRNTTTAR